MRQTEDAPQNSSDNTKDDACNLIESLSGKNIPSDRAEANYHIG